MLLEGSEQLQLQVKDRKLLTGQSCTKTFLANYWRTFIFSISFMQNIQYKTILFWELTHSNTHKIQRSSFKEQWMNYESKVQEVKAHHKNYLITFTETIINYSDSVFLILWMFSCQTFLSCFYKYLEKKQCCYKFHFLFNRSDKWANSWSEKILKNSLLQWRNERSTQQEKTSRHFHLVDCFTFSTSNSIYISSI